MHKTAFTSLKAAMRRNHPGEQRDRRDHREVFRPALFLPQSHALGQKESGIQKCDNRDDLKPVERLPAQPVDQVTGPAAIDVHRDGFHRLLRPHRKVGPQHLQRSQRHRNAQDRFHELEGGNEAQPSGRTQHDDWC